MNSFQWPTEAANAMKIVVDDPKQQHSHRGGGGGALVLPNYNQTFAKLEYDATDRYLHLVLLDQEKEDTQRINCILDTIDVEDMIGASIELAMTSHKNDTRHNSNNNNNNNNVIRAAQSSSSSLHYYSSNEPPCADAMDTQACAILHVYVYPRREPSRWWKNSLSRWGGRTTTTTTSTHPRRPTNPVAEHYGPRHAQHRHWTLAATEDLAVAQTVVQALRTLANGRCSSSPQQQQCLLLINPQSGPHKNAAALAEQTVIPLLEQAGLEVTPCVTTHPGHATERCRAEDVVTFDAIVTMGGDGILHEALNGLLPPPKENVLSNNNNNNDNASSVVAPHSSSSRRIRPTVGVIGCGTANGLAASLCHAAQETSSDILTHAFLIAKGQTVTADLSEYTITPITPTSTTTSTTNDTDHTNSRRDADSHDVKKYTSCMTFFYAIMADIDIESERLHCLGALRFDLWGALCVLRFRSYRGTFRYCTTTTTANGDTLNKNVAWHTMRDDFVCFMVSQTSHVSESVLLLTLATCEWWCFLFS